jgi:prefoldin subunit 5
MSKAKTIDISKFDLDDIIKALDVDRAGVAKICGGKISKGAVGWWRHIEKIPIAHLEALGNALEKKLRGRKDLNPVEERALALVKTVTVEERWDIAGAKRIVEDYKKPNEAIDIGNVCYAATQLEAAYDTLKKEMEMVDDLLEERDQLKAEVKILRSKASQFESTVTETMRVRDQYRSMCGKLAEALKEKDGDFEFRQEEALAEYETMDGKVAQ